MKHRILAWIMAAALTVGLLPTAALAAGKDWEHSGHDGWTELTTEKLNALSYTLATGKYYLSAEKEDPNAPFSNMFEIQPITVAAGAEVTLCINDVMYTYSGNENSAIIVNKGASLTICCCGSTQYAVLASNGSYAVENSGTLNMTSGRISSSVECGAAIYNAGICTISGGKVSGSAGNSYDGYKTAYGVYNAENGSLTITGDPEISGQAPGGSLDPAGPQIDVYTSDTITVHDLSNEFEGVNIGFYGEDGETVVSGVTDEDTAKLFTVTDPANSELNYNAEDNSLTFKKGEVIDYGSLYFAGKSVVNQTKYKIENTEDTTFSATLVEVEDAASEDYDLLWDEDTMTLTLNSAEVKASCEHESGSSDTEDALISLNRDAETTLNVDVIGENHLTALNPFSGWNSGFEESRVIENRNGGINFTGDGSLTAEVVADKYTYDEESGFNVKSMTAIYATGAVENQTNLTVTGSDEEGICQSMTGIACASFTNTGTFTAEISDADTACAVDTGDFANSGTLDVDFTSVGDGTGIQLSGGGNFTNSGAITIDIPDADSARGIGRYSASGEATDGDFNWNNTADGNITITVSGDGAAAAALGGQALAGLDLRSKGNITFTNDGGLTVTATSDNPASLNETNWPSWQYFDTFAVGLMPSGTGTVTNTGTMTLNAYNGYTAGLYVAGANENPISITSSGKLDIATTTKGRENIRSVGIYAEIPAIDDASAKTLNFDTTGGTVSISTGAAAGSTLDSDKLMAICLVQTFTGTVPTASDDFQQIEEEGIALSGEPIVYRQGSSVINTIGTGTTPAASVTIHPYTEPEPEPSQPSGGSGGSSATRYPVTVEDTDNGSIHVSPTRAERGDTVTITVDPDDGYELDELLVTDSDGDEISVRDRGNGKYTFTMPRSRVTVEATFAEIVEEPEALPFVDVPTGAYYYDAVAWAVENGVTNGTSATTFGPDVTCTRAQMVTFLWRAAGSPEPENTVNPFTDVSASAYYYDAVLWAVGEGITNGTSATTFSPDATVTRGQTVTFLWRKAGSPAASGNSFADVAADAYYATAVAWAAREGITSGTSATTFSPDNTCTRAQIVTFLWRYLV